MGGQLRFGNSWGNARMPGFFFRWNSRERHGQHAVFQSGLDGLGRDVGWELEGPTERTSSPLVEDISIVWTGIGRDLARDRQPVLIHVDGDIVS